MIISLIETIRNHKPYLSHPLTQTSGDKLLIKNLEKWIKIGVILWKSWKLNVVYNLEPFNKALMKTEQLLLWNATLFSVLS